MDLDELQSVQSRERQTDSLQQLRATFYQDAADYIQRLEDERDRAADRADDPWNAPEVGRLNDDIDTATQTVEAIYERRVGKIVKMASLAAADMPTDDDGLTEEEQALFETLVAAIEDNRESVFAILDGESPVESPGSDPASRSSADPVPDREGPSERDGATTPDSAEPVSDSGAGVDAADLMGDGAPATSEAPEPPANEGDTADSTAGEPSPDPETTGERTPDPDPGDGRSDVPPESARSAPDGGTRKIDGGRDGTDTRKTDGTASGTTDGRASGSTDGDPASSPAPADSGDAPAGDDGVSVDRATVKITDDVGRIFGVDERSYDLTADDVVVLPEANADPLVDRGAAERLD